MCLLFVLFVVDMERVRMGEDRAGKALALAEERRVAERWPTEKNIEESYLFAGAANNACELREYEDEVTLEDGSTVKRRFGYKPDPEYGDTTEFDRDVWRALMALAHRGGGIPEDGVIPFSVYQVVNILKLPRKGDSYRRVRDSMWKLRALELRDDIFKPGRKGFKQERFSLFNRVKFEGNEDRHGKASEHHFVEISRVIVQSYHGGYVREIDHAFYFSLRKNHARGLHSEIEMGRGEGLVWEVPVAVVADRLGMPKSYTTPSAKKRKLEPAHGELLRKRYLASVTFPDRYTVRYEVDEEFLRSGELRERRWTEEEEQTIWALIDKDVFPNAARELVATKGPAVCNFYLRGLPYQTWVTNPPAFLYRYISEERPLPIEPPQRALEESGVGSDGLGAGKERPDPDAARKAGERQRKDGYEWLFGEDDKESYEPSPDAEEVWRAVVEDLADKVDERSVEVWLGGIFACDLRANALSVVVPSADAARYVQKHFGKKIEGSLARRLDFPVALRILVGERA